MRLNLSVLFFFSPYMHNIGTFYITPRRMAQASTYMLRHTYTDGIHNQFDTI